VKQGEVYDNDLEEANKTLVIGKQLGMNAEIDNKVIQNLTKL
jgi:hypothetical protein